MGIAGNINLAGLARPEPKRDTMTKHEQATIRALTDGELKSGQQRWWKFGERHRRERAEGGRRSQHECPADICGNAVLRP